MTTWTTRRYKDNQERLEQPNQQWIDEGGRAEQVNLDGSTKTIITIDYAHHEVHGGSSFTTSDVVNVDTTTVKWMITTSSSSAHAHFQPIVECTGEMYEVFTEGADRTDGTLLTEVNRERNSSKTSGLTISRTPTGGTTDGATTLRTLRVGSTGVGSKTVASGGSRANSEFVLKPSTKYILSITTYANVYVSLHLDWYEHTSKE